MSANAAHFDDNQVPTAMGVIGTLGTADTAGTAKSLPISINPDNGALYVQDLSGAAGTTNVNVVGGTVVTTVGSIANVGQIHNAGTIANGSLSDVAMVHAGTISSVTSVANVVKGTITRVENGTLALITRTGNVGTLESGSVVVTAGTFLGSDQTATGSLTAAGQTFTVNTNGENTLAVLVTNTWNGTVKVEVTPDGSNWVVARGYNYPIGAFQSGTWTAEDDFGTSLLLYNVAGMSVFRGSMVSYTSGTVALSARSNMGFAGPSPVLITNGSNMMTLSNGVGDNITPGNVLQNMAFVMGFDGTNWDRIRGDTTNGLDVDVTRLAAGTMRLDLTPVTEPTNFGTLGTAGGSLFATISAASGAGTKHYVAGVDIVMDSGTADVRILAGSAIQGTGVLAAGKFGAGGGISKAFTPAFATGTNSELIYHFVGAGTAFITVRYWKGT